MRPKPRSSWRSSRSESKRSQTWPSTLISRQIFSGMGEDEKALGRLRRAADKRIGSLIFLRSWPSWERLRLMSGFEEFMEEHGL